MANWYVKRGNEIAGPLTEERVKELASLGRLAESDLIREGEAGEFVPASQVPGLLPDRGSADLEELEISSSQPAGKKKKSLPIVILILAVFGGFLMMGIIAAILLPAVQQARQAARRSQSKNNLKQIGLALYNYHDNFRVFPAGGTETADGKPYQSWQTAILPYVDQFPLFNRIDFDQPWTAPQNQALFKQEIDVYLNPNISERVSPRGLALSHYVGNSDVLKKNISLSFRQITDGTSNTILAMETGGNFKPWGDPTNIARPINVMGPGHRTSYRGGNQVLMSDGSVRFISEHIDPRVLEALSTPGGGERMGGF